MNFDLTKRPINWRLYGQYTVLFILVASCLFGPMLLTGHTLIWNTDAYNQHLPLLANFRQTVLNWLTKPGHPWPNWNFQWGLGTDTFQVYSYYTLGDVFAYLALLFPAAKITLAYQVIVIVRMYCVGLAFVWFAQHLVQRPLTIMAGTMTYLVNAYLIYASVAQPFFTTPFILFPILVVQIERILQRGSSWPLTLTFIWMLLSNYYLAFILGIGSGLYLLLRLGTHYRERWFDWRMYGQFLFASVTSLLVTAGMLIPEIWGITHSTRIGATFANGLKVYPAYYYVLLPKQLINGDDWHFMYWSALGVTSVIVAALVNVYRQMRRWPVISWSLLLGLVMMLIPAVGAMFNGGMSPSNRWTLLLYLPLAISVMMLVEDLPTLDHQTVKWIVIITAMYLVVLIGTFIFQNDDQLVLPLIALLLTAGMIVASATGFLPHARGWLVGLILVNTLLNGLYAVLPYDGSYAKEMLNRGEYQSIVANRYGGLDRSLTRQPGYRINTLVDQYPTAQKKNYNDLTSGLANIGSYFSLQNQYLGQFSTELGNRQYETNVPLQQVDNRTVWNHFLGVKDLFGQTTTKNQFDVPAGYEINQTTAPKVDFDHGQATDATSKADLVTTQTTRYQTKQAFPLLYWQDRLIQHSPSNMSAKERALASGVVVNAGLTDRQRRQLLTADLTGNVKSVPVKWISNRLTKLNPANWQVTDPEATAYLRPTKRKVAHPSEVQLAIEQIKFKPFSRRETIKYLVKHDQEQELRPGTAVNTKFQHYVHWRKLFLHGQPDQSYTLTFNKRFELQQPPQTRTSFYKVVKHAVINLGVVQHKLPKQISVTSDQLGTYQIRAKLNVIDLGPKYQAEVATIQRHALRQVRFGQDYVQGTITTPRAGILTSSIPYSTGWQVFVDGHRQRTLRTNTAFMGVYLPAGQHQVKFTYQTPWLQLGRQVSWLGLIWFGLAVIVTMVKKRR